MRLLKSFIILITLLFLICIPVKAQATHSVGLTWIPAGDSTTATIFHIYRALGSCANGVVPSTLTTLSFVRLDGASSAISSPNFTDATVGVGAFCYYVTAQLNGAESDPSLTAGAMVKPSSPLTPVAIPK